MSSARKRKSNSSQPTISKFFKATPKKKKVPVIKVLDDDDTTENGCPMDHPQQMIGSDRVIESMRNKQGRLVTEANNNLERIVCQTIKKSINRLKKYHFDEAESEVSAAETAKCFDSNDNLTEHAHQSEVLISNNSPSDCIASNFTRLNRVNDLRNNVYTPLERQVVSIKEKNKDVLLFVECGYKYRFFGEDAQIASKELNIFCHMDHSFMTASIPVHRLNVHLCRLVEKGYKVGVVKQTETAALKAAGENKNAPFTRKLTNVYTKATLVSETDFYVSSTGNYVACVNTLMKDDNIVVTAVLFANPATGEIIYDIYEDSKGVLLGLETIFHILKPCEIVIAVDFQNEVVMKFLDCYKKASVDSVRIASISNIKSLNVASYEKLLRMLNDRFLYDGLLGCIAIMTSYLDEFGLAELLLSVENYQPYSSKHSWMRLDKSAMRNLELFRNNLDNQVRGSLLWILDHTNTPFGKRLLKSWLSKPLMDAEKIEMRLAAVSELKHNLLTSSITDLKKELRRSLDLEKGLASIYFKRVTPGKFIKMMDDLERLRKLFVKHKEVCLQFLKSDILADIFSSVPEAIGTLLTDFLNELDRDNLANDCRGRLFKNVSNYPALKTCLAKIEDIERSLEEHLKTFLRQKLKDRNVVYKTVSNVEYLIEVRNTNVKNIPTDWIKVMCTKQFTRYRTPFVDETFKDLCRRREELAIASNDAWIIFLDKFLLKHQLCREVVQKIAVFDCFLSLATVANQPGYCKPSFPSDCSGINIKDGRHPVIDALLPESKQYVANGTVLSSNQKIMLISGPNMGGKSSYIKQTALICILAQIGSYVPATAASLDILDGVYTRMGGCDDIVRGKSTYMVELEEASLIMREATEKSLIILDELGRGTSTHDGTAIAYATLKYFIEDVKPYTLFVSHYPLLTELEHLSHGYVANFHMAFIETNENERVDETGDSAGNNIDSIVFLYQLSRGPAKKSYGLNVARLAGIPDDILQVASHKANEMENKLQLEDRLTLQTLLRESISTKSIKEKLSLLDSELNGKCLI